MLLTCFPPKCSLPINHTTYYYPNLKPHALGSSGSQSGLALVQEFQQPETGLALVLQPGSSWSGPALLFSADFDPACTVPTAMTHKSPGIHNNDHPKGQIRPNLFSLTVQQQRCGVLMHQRSNHPQTGSLTGTKVYHSLTDLSL